MTAAPQLVGSGSIDYLVADYLSEITMSLLTNAKHKSPVSQLRAVPHTFNVHAVSYLVLYYTPVCVCISGMLCQ